MRLLKKLVITTPMNYNENKTLLIFVVYTRKYDTL